MVPMNCIRQIIMIGMRGTKLPMYTCYRVFSFLNKITLYFEKNDKRSLYRVSKNEEIFFSAASIMYNVGGLW